MEDCSDTAPRGGLLVEDCFWRTARGGLLVEDCSWRTARGGLLVEDCFISIVAAHTIFLKILFSSSFNRGCYMLV